MHLRTNSVPFWGIKMTKLSDTLVDFLKMAIFTAFAGVAPIFILFIRFSIFLGGGGGGIPMSIFWSLYSTYFC